MKFQSPSVFAFGEFVLDEERGELLQGERPVFIRRTPLRLLAYLVRQPDRVLSKQELLEQVWRGVAVSDAAFATALKQVRRALAEDGRGPSRIETLRGRGLRLCGPVELCRTGGTTLRPLIGRVPERERLERALAGLEQGRGAVAVLSGEAGIGKTWLATRLLEQARAAGRAVATGTCREDTGAAYLPWVQILEELTAALPPEVRNVVAGDSPELLQLIPALGDAGTLPGEHARQRLHHQVGRFLRRVAEPGGLVLLLDDLQWCDADSLRMLDAVAEAVAAAPLLLLVAVREAESPPPVQQTLARLSRLPGERLALAGLTEAEVGELAASLRGSELEAAARRRLTERSGGNPFFVTELVRLRDFGNARRRDPELPVRVRDVIEARLRRLSQDTRALLDAAAVAGAAVPVGAVQSAGGLSAAEFLAALDEAADAGLLVEQRSGALRFSHALVQEAVVAALPRIARRRLHDALTEALEAFAAGGAFVPPSELARHAEAAVPLGSASRAVRYLKRAADAAAQQLALENAVESYRRALRLLDQQPGDRRVRAEVLIGLGRALGALGRQGDALAALREAADLARGLEDAVLLAQVGLAHPVGGALAASHTGSVDEALVEILDESAAGLDRAASPLRVRVLARLAIELYFTSDRARGIRLAEQALAQARALGDAGALGDALVAEHYGLWTPENLETRLALSAEIVALGRSSRNPVLTFQGLLSQVSDQLERGDLDAVRCGLEEQRRCAEYLHLPLYRWAASNTWPTLAIAEGRIDEAERLARETLAAAQGHENPDIVNGFSGQMFMILRERDQLDTLLPIVESHVERFPEMSVWRCALAFVHGELGAAERAQREFEVLAQGSFAALKEDMFRLFNLVMLTEVCSFLGDGPRAAALARMLRPYEGRNITVGGLVMAGAGATYLAKLRAAEGRFDDAERLFGRGREMNARMGARLWWARACLDHARTLVRRGRAVDRERAAGLLTDARKAAEELGLVAVMRCTRELASELPPAWARSVG